MSWLDTYQESLKYKYRTFIETVLLTEPPVPCDFKVGDFVTFTNENGVEFHGMEIIGFSQKKDMLHGNFIHLGGYQNAYWFPHHPGELEHYCFECDTPVEVFET